MKVSTQRAMKEARAKGQARGHNPQPFSVMIGNFGSSRATCRSCGRQVVVTTAIKGTSYDGAMIREDCDGVIA